MLLLCVFLLSGVTGQGQTGQLPTRSYTTSDGLARDYINSILLDSQGFLWFGTEEGLSHFDGYKFKNYTTDDGLPSRRVSTFLETRYHEYWIGTGDGLCRFNPSGRPQQRIGSLEEDRVADSSPMFVCQRVGPIHSLIEDRSGVVWCGTDDGLYQVVQDDSGWRLRSLDLGMPRVTSDDRLAEATKLQPPSCKLPPVLSTFICKTSTKSYKYIPRPKPSPRHFAIGSSKSRARLSVRTYLCKLIVTPKGKPVCLSPESTPRSDRIPYHQNHTQVHLLGHHRLTCRQYASYSCPKVCRRVGSSYHTTKSSVARKRTPT